MTTVSLTTPTNVGTRDLVRAWLSAELPEDIEEMLVVVDCGPLRAPSSSFIDELIKIIVVERATSRLQLIRPSERARALAIKSAFNYGVLDRVDIPTPAPEKRGRLALRPRLSR